MNDVQVKSAEIARAFLASNRERIDERSRLFEDLQQFALEALETVRRPEWRSKSSRMKLPAEPYAHWPDTRRAA